MNTSLKNLRPQRPSLFRLAADGHSLDFFFCVCDACSRLTFPANAPGCAHCGAPLDSKRQVTRPGGGKLLEFVTLHVPLVPDMPSPMVAGDIEIAEGVFEEGVIAMTNEQQLHIGMQMRAIAVPLDLTDTFACRFVPAMTTNEEAEV